MVVSVKACRFVKPRLRRDIDLAADYRLYALFFLFSIKVDHAVHYAVVGDCQRIKAFLLCGGGNFADSACAVKQTVFGMNM